MSQMQPPALILVKHCSVNPEKSMADLRHTAWRAKFIFHAGQSEFPVTDTPTALHGLLLIVGKSITHRSALP